MIEIDTGMLAIFVTVLLSIISLAAWLGALWQRVKGQGETIEDNRKLAERERERIHTDNRQDHAKIFDQLEKINSYIRNNKH